MSENSKSFLQTISSSWEHKELLTSSWAKKDVVALLQIPTKSNYKNTAIQKYEIPATTLRSPRCEPNYLPLTNTKYQKSNTKIQNTKYKFQPRHIALLLANPASFRKRRLQLLRQFRQWRQVIIIVYYCLLSSIVGHCHDNFDHCHDYHFCHHYCPHW